MHAQQLIGQWDRARWAVTAAASTSDTMLTVGFQTSIGRGLIPAVTARMAQDLPGWRLTFRQIPWADPSVGFDADEVDVAIAWLPLPADDTLSWKVVTVEDRWVALPVGHRLARRKRVPFAELAAEPFVALPASTPALRDFWLAADHRDTPATVAMTAGTADETFEAVAAGHGVALLAAGNAELYQRDDLVFRPVTEPARGSLAHRRHPRGGAHLHRGLLPVHMSPETRPAGDRTAVRGTRRFGVAGRCPRLAVPAFRPCNRTGHGPARVPRPAYGHAELRM